MKKFIPWLIAISFIVFVIDWAVVGIKLFSGDYDITAGAYIGLACIIVILACTVYKGLSDKCPHCGRVRASKGSYCAHCGKKIT